MSTEKNLENHSQLKENSLPVIFENSLPVIISADLCHVFECEEVVYGMGVFMSGTGPHLLKFPYDLVQIHILWIYSDIVE